MEAPFLRQSMQLLSKAKNVTPRTSVVPGQSSLDAKSLRSYEFLKCFPLTSHVMQRGWIALQKKGKMRIGIRASLSSSSSSSSQLAPLQLDSPVGQFLSQILISHPHLVPAAVDQQLERLLSDLDSEKSREEPNPNGIDLGLYRRIAELKAKERRKALEEILYALVVQKFVDSEVSMVSSMPNSSNGNFKIVHWPSSEEIFHRLHSPEAFEMIRSHLSVILGNRLEDSSSAASISKLRVEQVYAASVLYGYFIKRVDQRFQLDKFMKAPPWESEEDGRSSRGKRFSMEAAVLCSSPASAFGRSSRLSEDESSSRSSAGFNSPGELAGMKPYRLRTYVMSLDSETLKRFACVRSKEAISIIQKHIDALFMQQHPHQEGEEQFIKLSFSGLKRLILEAVTFGCFLWEVECYVDSRYRFVSF